MSLLGGGMAAVFGEVFGGVYLDGRLYRDEVVRQSGGTLVTNADPDGTPMKYQPERTTQAMRDSEGYTDKDIRVFILTAGVGGELLTDHEFTDAAPARWQVVTAALDPAGTYWDVHARPARAGAGG